MKLKPLMIVLVLGLLGYLAACTEGDKQGPDAPAPAIETRAGIPGKKIEADWTPAGEIGEKGTAFYAEALFWDVFHSQDYKRTPDLFEALYSGLASSKEDEFSQALMNGRLGFLYLWVGAEDAYAQADDTIGYSTIALNQQALIDGKLAVSGGDTSNYVFWEGKVPNPLVPSDTVFPPNFVWNQISIHFLKEATYLIMDISNDSTAVQLQNWSLAKGSSEIPGTQAAWPTFPAVVTGFYANFDKFPPPPFGIKAPGTIPITLTESTVTHSLGFNFASPVFGDVGGHHLGPNDLKLMIQMFKLAANEEVGAAIIPGDTSSYPGNYAAYKDFYTNKLAKFFSDHKHYQKDTIGEDIIQIWPSIDLDAYWNKAGKTPVPVPGYTSPNIVKASSGTSFTVPANTINNFMMLGDTYVAAYTDIQTVGGEKTYSLPTEVEAIALQAYQAAQGLNTFEGWVYKYTINGRVDLINSDAKDKYEQLYKAAQNDSKAMGNMLNYANCMTCHQHRMQ